MEHFVYFVSYFVRRANGETGFGNGNVDLKKKLETQRDFYEIEKGYIDALNAKNVLESNQVTNVVILNFQLLKQFKEE